MLRLFLLLSLLGSHLLATGFVPNVGQLRYTDGIPAPQLRYVLRLPGLSVYVTEGSLHYVQEKRMPDGEMHIYRTDLLYPQHSTDLTATNPTGPELRWCQPGEPMPPATRACSRLLLTGVAPGVDLELLVQNEQLKYNLLARDPQALAGFYWTIEGAALRIQDGQLLLTTPMGTLAEHIPAAWHGTAKQPLRLSYALQANRVGYALPAGTPATLRQLVVDPLLRNWATFWGGGQADVITDVALGTGGTYAWCGHTTSTDFPTQNGVQTVNSGGKDAVVGRSQANGNPLWATYLGDDGEDEALAVTLAADGKLYVGGRTSSSLFPTFDAVQPLYAGDEDGWLCHFLADGTFIWGTYLGGAGSDRIADLQLSPDGYLLLAGYTTSSALPGTGGAQASYGGNGDGFLAKMTTNGRIRWMGYYGGDGYDEAATLLSDLTGTRYHIAGTSHSTNLPVPGAAQATNAGGADGYWAMLDSSGTILRGTYLGGTDDDNLTGMVLDSAWKPALVGHTFSADWPTLSPIQATNAGHSDIVLARLDTLGTLLWSTYLGGQDFDFATGIAANRKEGRLYPVGYTASTDFPLLGADFLNAYRGGQYDAWWMELTEGPLLAQSTYYGGQGADRLLAVAADSTRMLAVGNAESGTNFPLLNAAQFFYGGGSSDGLLLSYRYTTWPAARDEGADVTFGLYPNPTTGRLAISGMVQPATATLTDLQGRKLLQVSGPSPLQLDLSSLPAGVYLLRIGTAVQRVVKQ